MIPYMSRNNPRVQLYGDKKKRFSLKISSMLHFCSVPFLNFPSLMLRTITDYISTTKFSEPTLK